MSVGLKIDSLKFSDGCVVDCSQSNVIIITGPNNAGKSRTLMEIQQCVLSSPSSIADGKVLKSIEVQRFGSEQGFWDLMKESGTNHPTNQNTLLVGYRNGTTAVAPGTWPAQPGSEFNNFFFQLLTAGDRIHLADAIQSIHFGQQPKTQALHYLHQDEVFLKKFSNYCAKAFGVEVGFDPYGGPQVSLHIGKDAAPTENEQATSKVYRARLNVLPKIEEQGDGIRSFVGLTLHCLPSHKTLTLIDEPEAFLHPPQAKLMANFLVDEQSENNQLVFATHSIDILLGVLASSNAKILIIRLQRVNNVSRASTLSADEIKLVWSDPTLRYSNILNGLFHEKVIICEAEGDCRFYNAMADAIRSVSDHPHVKDVLFTPAGGKAAMPKLVKALKKLDVPVCVAVDFDIFRDINQFKRLLGAFELAYSDFAESYDIIRHAIDHLGTKANRDVKTDIINELEKLDMDSNQVPRKISDNIRSFLKPGIGWSKAKQVGIGILSPGVQMQAGMSLIDRLATNNILIVSTGELESFVPSETSDKNEWVNNILEKYVGSLESADELKAARDFTAKLLRKRL